MTTEELQDAIFNGIDKLAAENKISHLSTQLISRYSGISEGKMLRHIPSLDKVITKWLKGKEAEINNFLNSFPATKAELLIHINLLVNKGDIATLLLSSNLDPLLDIDNLKKARKQLEKHINDVIKQLEDLPDRPTADLANELMFCLKAIVETNNAESQRKKASLAKDFPWEAENELFPAEDILKRLATNESGFVFDPVSGRSYTANETAVSILQLLRETVNTSTIVDRVTEEYDVTREAAERDILEFAGRLRGVL
ncbi:MAG: PqqD family protein [Gammaproteobacteria bacterium]|nr:MAG: PqqD family protein [Gammaproteobacteria bacterium]